MQIWSMSTRDLLCFLSGKTRAFCCRNYGTPDCNTARGFLLHPSPPLPLPGVLPRKAKGIWNKTEKKNEQSIKRDKNSPYFQVSSIFPTTQNIILPWSAPTRTRNSCKTARTSSKWKQLRRVLLIPFSTTPDSQSRSVERPREERERKTLSVPSSPRQNWQKRRRGKGKGLLNGQDRRRHVVSWSCRRVSEWKEICVASYAEKSFFAGKVIEKIFLRKLSLFVSDAILTRPGKSACAE